MASQTWYEKNGWQEDPLDWRTSSKFIVGLEKPQDNIRQFIKKGKPIVLFGPTGTGKSTIVQHLADNKDHICILLNGDKLSTQPRKIVRLIKEKVTVSGTEGDSLKPIVVFVDEAIQTPKGALRELKGLFDEKDIRSFVLVQISNDLSKYPEQFRSRLLSASAFIETSLLSEEELFQLIDKRLDGKTSKLFEEGALRAIIRYAKNPRLILDICSDVLDFKNGTGKVTLSDTQEVIRRRQDVQVGVSENVTDKRTLKDISQSNGTASGTVVDSTLSEEQDEICALISAKPLNRNELAGLVKKSSPSSIGKLLGKLEAKGKIRKTEGRPAKYVLDEGYQLQRMSDVRK